MQILTDDDAFALKMNALCAAGETGVTKDDMKKLLDWANGVMFDYAALQAVLNGDAFVKWDDTEPCFRHRQYCEEAAARYDEYRCRPYDPEK
jgi:hypothetical protein